jgi:hypothetical protein
LNGGVDARNLIENDDMSLFIKKEENNDIEQSKNIK